MTRINESSGYGNLKGDKNIHIYPHLHVNLAGKDLPDCHLGWHKQVVCSSERYMKSPKDLPSVFGTADDILIVEYDAIAEITTEP